jgi:hypothetical protein
VETGATASWSAACVICSSLGSVTLNLLCALNLGVAIASVQEAVRKVRKGFAIGEVSKFGELRGGKLALKPREAAGRDGGGSGESAAGAGSRRMAGSGFRQLSNEGPGGRRRSGGKRGFKTKRKTADRLTTNVKITVGVDIRRACCTFSGK